MGYREDDMTEITFQSLRELYQRLEPALETKRIEMNRAGYSYIKKEDIWNYLKENKWKKGNNLELADLVSDILNTDPVLIDSALKQELQRQTRQINLDGEL